MSNKIILLQPFSLKQISGCVLYQNIASTLYCISERYIDFCFCNMYQGCAKKYYNGKIFACELYQLVEDVIPAYYSKNKYDIRFLINESIRIIARLKEVNKIIKRDLISDICYKYLLFCRDYNEDEIRPYSIFDSITPDQFRF